MFGNRMSTAGSAGRMHWAFGEVISVEDPYRMYRAQVRLAGLTDDKRGIPDEDLPWYPPLMPVTSASLAGAGNPSCLEPGSKVMVALLDYPSCQHGFIVGSHYPGVASPSHVSPLGKGLKEKGPPLPTDSMGQILDMGFFGNVGIIDKFNDAIAKFSKMLDLAQIFRNLQIWKIDKK